jgi:hypothetical protein
MPSKKVGHQSSGAIEGVTVQRKRKEQIIDIVFNAVSTA